MNCTVELITCFLGGFVAPLPFLFVAYLVRQLKKTFLDASGIKVE